MNEERKEERKEEERKEPLFPKGLGYQQNQHHMQERVEIEYLLLSLHPHLTTINNILNTIILEIKN